MDAAALAVAYQLVTDRTNFLMVHAREESEAPTDLPELHSVAQMLPAGWGGTGSVLDELFSAPDLDLCLSSPVLSEMAPLPLAAPDLLHDCSEEDVDYLNMPASLPRSIDSDDRCLAAPPPPARSHRRQGRSPLDLCNWLRRTPYRRWPKTYDELRRIGLDDRIVEWLEQVIAGTEPNRWTEGQVVATFLGCLASDEVHNVLDQTNRFGDAIALAIGRLREAIAGTPKHKSRPSIDPDLATKILPVLESITSDQWPKSTDWTVPTGTPTQ